MDSSIDKILNLYNKWGSHDYIGENITQIDHAIQCSQCAEHDQRLELYDDFIRNSMIVAALLHDIGHLVGLEQNDMPMLNGDINLGIVGHEGIGAAFLKDCGFPSFVCELVASHVQAKRYLCSTNSEYYNKLSDASKETMKLQGGLMTTDEITQFKNGLYPELKCYLREYDDIGKLQDITNTTDTINKTLKYNSTIMDYKKTIETSLIFGHIFP